jgi:hypothetical protein
MLAYSQLLSALPKVAGVPAGRALRAVFEVKGHKYLSTSWAAPESGGNGVNMRSLGKVTATVAKGLVYCMSGQSRIYFTGRQGPANPYAPNLYGG